MDAFKNFLGVLSPFFIGILIAYVLYLPSRKLESIYKKSKVKFIQNKARTLSILTSYVVFIVLAVLVLNFVFPVLVESLTELVNNIQHYGDVTIQKYKSLPEDSLLKSDTVTDLIKGVQNIDVKQYNISFIDYLNSATKTDYLNYKLLFHSDMLPVKFVKKADLYLRKKISSLLTKIRHRK